MEILQFDDKMKASLLAGLVFAIIASPFLYALVNKVTQKLGLTISSADGCPNYYGLAIHTVVFMIVTRLVMHISL